jgi:periplasmic protein TonB
LEEEHKLQFSNDASVPRSQRHLASFAASIAAHAAIVGLIVCFASPLARGHSEWVLAYLIEGADGSAGRGGADAAASRAAEHAAGAAPARAPIATTHSAPKAARKRRRRLEEPASEVASMAPTRPVALARPAAPAPEVSAVSLPHGDNDTASTRPAAAGSGSGADRGGAGSPGAADGGAGDDPNSLAHADYASNPPPIYPVAARRREQQGTVTVKVLVGADGSVESAEIADSSGFDALDNAALDTVRSRWRFVPARHGGLAVESWVLVPIRFALLEANALR